jgi:hypothetical protein
MNDHDAPLNEHKRQNNVFFAEQLPVNGRVLILDGSGLNTTDAIIRNAGKKVFIDIVEYDCETARETFNAILRKNYSNVNVILGQLGTFLRQPENRRMYDGVFMDTVATWAGNQQVMRAGFGTDLVTLAFEQKIFATGAIFALTILENPGRDEKDREKRKECCSVGAARRAAPAS